MDNNTNSDMLNFVRNYFSINLSVLNNRKGSFLDYVTTLMPCLQLRNSKIDYFKVVLRSQAFNGSVYVDDTSLSVLWCKEI